MRIKIVTFQFPPYGGSGVQRIVKFIKYWSSLSTQKSVAPEIEVITSKAILKANRDLKQAQELRQDVKIKRYTSLDPMFLTGIFDTGRVGIDSNNRRKQKTSFPLQALRRFMLLVRDFMRLPDQYFLWAVYAGIRETVSVNKSKVDVIFTTIPTYSSAFLGCFLAWLHRCPHVIDFRDSWTDDPYLNLPTKIHRQFHKFWEKFILSRASLFVVYNEWLEQIFRIRYPQIPCIVVKNGYDPDDINHADITSFSDKELLTYAYTGTIFDYHEEFVRNVFSFFKNSRNKKFEIIFACEIQLLNFQQLLDEYELTDRVKILGYLPHKESVGLLKEADILLFTVPNGDMISLTGKVFEYLGVNKPILSVIQKNSAIEGLLRRHGHGDFCSFYDQESLSVANANASYQYLDFPGTKYLNEVNRKNQAQVVFNELLNLGNLK